MKRLLLMCFLSFAVAAAAEAQLSSSARPAAGGDKPAPEAKPETLIRGYNNPRRIPGQFIVVFNWGEQRAVDRAMSLAAQNGAKLLQVYEHALQGFVIQASDKAAMAIARDPQVAFVEADQTMSIDATQSPTPSWGLDRIDQTNLPLNNSYTFNFDGTGVHAYVIDTGIRVTHNDFGGRASGAFTAINDGNGSNDCNGHGTHVAGTIGSATYGVAKNVILHAVRVLDCNGSGSNSGVIAGVDWVTANHISPAVANMSLGGGVSTALDNAVNNSVASGVFYAVAAGNENTNACNSSPSRAANVYTVGSSTNTDARSSFSNFGTCVEIFAPGSNITSTWSTSNTATNTISGTSMATPHVAGAAALILDESPSLTPTQVANTLTNNATTGVLSGIGTGSPNRLLFSLTSGGGGGGGGGGGTTSLTSGVPVTGLSGAQNAQSFFTISVPAGASNLSVAMSGGSGDADLYVRFGSAPTLSTYDCRPFLNGNNENCSFTNPAAGTWHIMINGFTAYSGVSLVATVTGGGGGGPSIVYSENFDTGSAPGWNKSSGTTDLWRVASDCVDSPSGNFTISFSRASPNCDYDGGTRTGWARSPRINLSGFSSATLMLSHLWQTETFSGGAFDIMRIEVSTNDGSTWTTIKQIDSRNANSSGFVVESLNITNFMSANFRVRLFFDTVDSSFNDFLGWYVDDIEVLAQ